MAIWDPWIGCRRCSEGCRYCYIHKRDAKRGIDTSFTFRQCGSHFLKDGKVYNLSVRDLMRQARADGIDYMSSADKGSSYEGGEGSSDTF